MLADEYARVWGLSRTQANRLLDAPRLVERAILKGWIQPPKYKLTDAQIDNLMRR